MTTRSDANYRLEGKRVWVAGYRGMVGAAVVRRLASERCEILTVGRGEVDLRRQAEVESWMKRARPQAVVLAAATVGGILANDTRPGEFLYDNLAIQTNVIHAAKLEGVEKLLFLGSSCIYPRLAEQPIREDALLTGPLEPTNEWYAVAKIAGIKMCGAYRKQYGCDFISAMPTNLYGPHDNFDLETSHVLPALMRKVHEGKRDNRPEVEVWGTGAAKREFLFVDDMADACLFLMDNYSGEDHVNLGTGVEVSIRELAESLVEIINPAAQLLWDPSKPDGAPRKLLDVSRLHAMGWTAQTSLAQGVAQTYAWFEEN